MFDIIELNDTTDTGTSTPQSSTQETTMRNQVKTNAPSATPTTVKEFIESTSSHNTKPQKPTKKEAYKSSDKKQYKPSSTSSSKSEKQQTESLNKEVEMYPIVRDPSEKLNRTFRKELPVVAEDINTVRNNFGASKVIDLSINNDLSSPINEHIQIKFEGKGRDNITETVFITTSRHVDQKSPGYVSEEIDVAEVESNTQFQEIDPRIDVLNSNMSRDNDSESLDENATKETTQASLSELKKKFLPKSLLGETEATTRDDVSGNPLEEGEEQQPRPNRQRQLTRPQRRSFYPYFFSRVLG